MDLQLNYELNATLLMEGQIKIRRTRYLIMVVYSVLLTLVGLAALAIGDPWKSLGWVGVVGGPLTWLFWMLQLRRIVGNLMAMATGPFHTELKDDVIRQQLPSMSSEVQWQAVKSVKESKHLWLLMINAYQALHIPKSALGPEGEATLRAFLKDRGVQEP